MKGIAKTKESYFLSENLKDITELLENLKRKDSETYIYQNQYRNGVVNIYEVVSFSMYSDSERYFSINRHLEYIKASPEDLKIIISAIENEKEKFEKRLKTYLKRYGLTKLKTWTYWQDE